MRHLQRLAARHNCAKSSNGRRITAHLPPAKPLCVFRDWVAVLDRCRDRLLKAVTALRRGTETSPTLHIDGQRQSWPTACVGSRFGPSFWRVCVRKLL